MAASDKSVAASFATDFSSDSAVSDGWQELTKSDYAKVIFSDLLCNAALGTVECKFQITDNVHEDPNDYVGLFRIGYEDLTQCLVSKMLSQTKCEDDGKLQRCVFTANELPCLDDGFYQFLYVTRDQEVCGASMPFQITMSPFQSKKTSVESGSPEKMDGGFLLVNNELERKVEVESVAQEETIVQRSALSEQKKEEIAAWVSQNPDYYSLIEQIKEHTFTIDALQQSKDLAMKEVAQLYEILNQQNGELIQVRNMLAAYEEKIKISQSLLEKKDNEIIQLSNVATAYKEKMEVERTLRQKKNIELDTMKFTLGGYEQKLKVYQQLDDEKTTELDAMKLTLGGYEQKLKVYQQLENEKHELLSEMKRNHDFEIRQSLNREYQQRMEINNLKKELEEMRELQKARECQKATAEIAESMDSLVQKAKNFIRTVSATIKALDYTDEAEVEKFYKFKIQLLILSSITTRYTELANICNRNGLHKIIHSIIGRDAKENSCDGYTPCALEDTGPLLTTSNVVRFEVAKYDLNSSSSSESSLSAASSSSAEIVPLPASSGKENINKEDPKEIVQRIPLNKLFKSEVLDYQIIELPRLDVINTDTVMTLQTDGPLDVEDVTVVNRLTEKIVKRGLNLYESIELVDDSSSDSGSDVSEISECSSSIKKDLLCVSRVMEALSSSLSNKTSLEQLVLVENEEDKKMICRKEWDVLLQKCALHYQIEILLEHIEKQKEGMKKVSDKICELLTKCMLLKDEVHDSKEVCEKLQIDLDKKDMQITKLTGDMEFKNSLVCHLCRQKEELECKTEIAEKTVADFHARIMEACEIYKKQYTKIGKLSKKLEKYKSIKDKTKASKSESSMTSSGSSKTTSSFEMVQPDSVQNVNDSDTGEHMFPGFLALVSNEKNHCSKFNPFIQFCGSSQPPVNPFDGKVPKIKYSKWSEYHPPTEACEVKHKDIQPQIDSNKEIKTLTGNWPDSCPTPLEDLLPSIHELKIEHSIASSTADKLNTATIECISHQTASVISDFASYGHFEAVIKKHFDDIKHLPRESKNSRECSISCFVCKVMLPLHLDDPSDFMNHFEKEHSIKICPVCGQLFEDAIPQKYFHIHVDQHFD